MLQKLTDSPLETLNGILSKSNRRWLGTSNWVNIISRYYPALKIDENKTNNGRLDTTYYENNGMCISIYLRVYHAFYIVMRNKIDLFQIL